jgi:hypothetical protein
MNILKGQLLLSILFLNIQSYAQMSKGKIMLNGNGSYYQSKNERNEATGPASFHQNEVKYGNFNLNIGYFISNNFALGITERLGTYGASSSNTFVSGNVSIQTNKTNYFYTGLFIRYNQPFAKSKFGGFLQMNVLYNWGRSEQSSIYIPVNFPENKMRTAEKSYRYVCSLTPGLYYFVTNKLSIEASLGNLFYENGVDKSTTGDYTLRKSNQFNSNFSISTLNLGLTFYFGKDKSETKPTE